MKTSNRLQLLLTGLASLALAACGGGTPVAGYKDHTLTIEGGDRMTVWFNSCNPISDRVTVTANGHTVPRRKTGGFTIQGCESPLFSLHPLPDTLMGPEPTNLQLELADETGAIHVEVEKLLGNYALVSRRRDLVQESQDAVLPPVLSRGEQVTFELQPGTFPILELRADARNGNGSHFRTWDLTPQVNGASFTVTVPGDLPAGTSKFTFVAVAHPPVRRCEGAGICDARFSVYATFPFRLE